MAVSLREARVRGRRAVKGGARLEYETTADGGTTLLKQWVRPPLHLAKVYREGDWAISLLTSPTAGLLEGDSIEIEASVGEGAKASLISPAACRVHTMAGGHASVTQKYSVAAGGFLDVWPAPMILQKLGAVNQRTELHVDETATAFLCEVVAPGRAAYGEAFEFDEWRSKLRICRQGELLAYENFSCRPSDGDVIDWRSLYPSGNCASVYFLNPEVDPELVDRIHELEIQDASLGASLLRVGGLGVKVLASNGLNLREAVFSVRKLLFETTGRVLPRGVKRAQTYFH